MLLKVAMQNVRGVELLQLLSAAKKMRRFPFLLLYNCSFKRKKKN